MSATAARLSEVDALRGLAAMAVVLFHFSTRYHQLYGEGEAPIWGLTHGHFGVNLFFIISGFVIFMTLERTRRPMDFVVSRFSRLFPAYWMAIALTFAVVAGLGLPGKEVHAWQAVANGLMLHNLLLKVPHVDGVYWTLEVELLFYVAMFTLYRLGWLRHVHRALLAGLLLALVYEALAQGLWLGLPKIDLPWIAYRLLFLSALPWFALGITIYQLVRSGSAPNAAQALTLALALLVLALREGPAEGLLAIAFAALVWAAASGHLPLLRWRVLVFLGAISYPLYLLHENIGWAVQRQLTAAGWSQLATVPVVVALSIALAWALHRSVELPAMQALRAAYARRRLAEPSP